jgi:hypothetical protein
VPQLVRPIALVSKPSPMVRTLRIIAILVVTTTVFVFGVAILAVATAE